MNGDISLDIPEDLFPAESPPVPVDHTAASHPDEPAAPASPSAHRPSDDSGGGDSLVGRLSAIQPSTSFLSLLADSP
jgi:hypothetical protein